MTSPNLPDAFWSARPLLTQIRQHARSRYASPDAVLHIFLAAYAWRVPALYTVENPLGDPLHLVHQPLLVGPSGSGKSLADNAARRLLTEPSQVEVRHPNHDEARKILGGPFADTFFYVTPFDPEMPEQTEPLQGPPPYATPATREEPYTIRLADSLTAYLRTRARNIVLGLPDPQAGWEERVLQVSALLRLLDGPNLPDDGYMVTDDDWGLAVQIFSASWSLREHLLEERRKQTVAKYRNRILDRVHGNPGCSLSHILQGWSSLNTRSTIRDVVLPALVADGTLTLQDERYTA